MVKTLIVFTAAALLSAAQVPNLSGVWKLNQQKSKWAKNQAAPVTVVVTITHQEPSLKYSGTVTGADDQTRNFDFTGAIDGKPYQENGSGETGTVTYKRVDARTVDAEYRDAGGKLVQTARNRISADGRTLIREITADTADGQMKWTEVYDRLPPPGAPKQ